ncbi:MAG: hypothetical protein AAF478_14150, partial [Pseudomonadota bacterium]
MTRTLILHLGTDKTGSTSLQRILHLNRKKLRNQGILVPESFGKFNHDKLVSALLDDDVFDNVKLKILARNNWTIDQLRRHIRNSFENDLKNHPATDKIIFTSELIHSRMFRNSSINSIAEYFSGIVDEVKVIVFLRRQDRLAVSRFSTILKGGYTEYDNTFADLGARSYVNTPIDKLPNDFLHYYDYEHLLQRFVRQFGRESICPIIYREDSYNIAEEFLRAAEIPIGAIKKRDTEIAVNRSLSARAQYLICQVNKIVDIRDETNNPNRDFRKLYARISNENPGKKRIYARAEAKNFYDKFRKSNEWVRANFFPDASSLFDDDFSCYPEKIDQNDLQPELLDAAANYYKNIRNPQKINFLT